MPFTTGKARVTPNRGTNSYILMWDQPDGWDVRNASGDYPQYRRESSIDSNNNRAAFIYQPQSSNLSIVRAGTTINASYFKGSPIHSKEGEGPGTVEGDLSFNLSGNGTQQILRNILQVENPSVVRKGAYAETSILAPVTATGDSASTTFVDDLTDVPVPLPITITLGSSPSITEASGHITIDGKDRNGGSATDTVEWTPADITAGNLVKTTKVHFSEITQSQPEDIAGGQYQLDYQKPPTHEVVDGQSLMDTPQSATTDPNQDGSTTDTLVSGGIISFRDEDEEMPVYLQVSNNTALSNGRSFGVVYVTGTDHKGIRITDRVYFRQADLAQTGPPARDPRIKRTSFYFASVSHFTSEGFSAGTYTATGVNEAATVTMEPSTDIINPVTFEVGKGSKIGTYRNCLISSTSINFSRTEPVRTVCTIVGGEPELGVNVSGGNSPTNRAGLRYTSDDVLSGWRASISAGDREYAVQSATLTINHNLEPSELLGDKYPSAPPTSSDEREILLTLELLSTVQNDFRDVFDNNFDTYEVTVTLTNTATAAFRHQFKLEFPRLQITTDPDYVVADFGLVGETLTMRSIFHEDFPYEIRALLEYSNYYPLLDYSS